MIIKKPENCGNSPKNKFIEEIFIKLFSGTYVKSDEIDKAIVLEFHGLRDCNYLEDIFETLQKQYPFNEVQIFDAISHGKKGSIDIKVKCLDNTIKNIGCFIQFSSHKADKINYIKLIIA